MPVTVTDYLRPSSLKEALALLAEDPAKTIAVGGGISVVLSGAPRRVRAVDLQHTGINEIKKTKDELCLGAMASLDDLVKSPLCGKFAGGVLCEGLRTAATEPIRRLITVGGNIVQCYYWATLPPLLIALDGRVHLRSVEHRRTVKASEFFARPPMRQLDRGELITEVSFPLLPKRVAAFEKLAKTSNDYALIHVVVSYVPKRGKVSDARVVVAACTNLPVRCAEVESYLEGQTINFAVAKEAGQLATHHVKLRGDFRASSEYRRRVLPVLVQRALLKAAKKQDDFITNR
ncbi:MAG: FAD binding domain-containing protein [Candidatus Sumerlaeaceae bacterium]|nr:FAD binding domain-containing protein [Candidatus Sumerlaeaceae bacterium]